MVRNQLPAQEIKQPSWYGLIGGCQPSCIRPQTEEKLIQLHYLHLVRLTDTNSRLIKDQRCANVILFTQLFSVISKEQISTIFVEQKSNRDLTSRNFNERLQEMQF